VSVDLAAVLGYGGVASLAIMSPGADFAVVLKQASLDGRRGGLRAALGVTLGFTMHASAAAAGIGALLLTSALAFTAVKLVGAAYLLYLGVRSLRSAVAHRRPTHQPQPARRSSRPVREAFLVNALNPKVVLTYLALMPQFLPADSATGTTVLLSLVTIGIAGLWFSCLALAVAVLRPLLTRERVRRTIDGVTGTVLVAFGARLANESR
jgi:threonine/homoserine/homoserine lactone efflux protein